MDTIHAHPRAAQPARQTLLDAAHFDQHGAQARTAASTADTAIAIC